MRTAMLAAAVILAPFALADGTVQQKTQVHVGGGLGAIVNVFGGKATHEGQESTVVLKGDRKSTRHDSSGEIVDLSEEKVYHLDYDRQTYTVVTFDELRKQYREQQERAAREREKSEKRERSAKKEEGPEYEVEFDVKDPGRKETINGFATRQQLVTITVHEKGKTLEKGGGFVLNTDMAMGPKIPLMRELAAFDRRYFTKIYGTSDAGADMQQMAAAMAATPAFAKAMKAFSEKRGNFSGTPVRTTMSFETVSGSEEPQSANDREDSSPAAAIGGFLNKMKKKRQERSEEKPGRSSLFDSTNEVLSVTSTAPADALTIPAGFHRK